MLLHELENSKVLISCNYIVLGPPSRLHVFQLVFHDLVILVICYFPTYLHTYPYYYSILFYILCTLCVLVNHFLIMFS